MLSVAVLAPGTEAARSGPPEGSSAWLRGQQLLERPGPALAAALEARRRGDRLRAEWLLAEISLRHPVIADHADLMRAQILLEQQRAGEAAGVAGQALAVHPDTLLRADLLSVQGHALALAGDEAGARTAWRAALDESRDEDLRASMLLAIARSHERKGELDRGIETHRVLWHLYPLSDEAEVASARLDELEKLLGEPLRSAADWRRRADNLYRARRNPEALAAYETAIAMGLSRSQEARAKRQRAHALFRMRDYPRAVEAFAALPQTDDVPIWHARSMARADRVNEAIDEFKRLGSERRGPYVLQARLLAAMLLEGRGRTEEARRYLESLIRARAGSGMRQASLWRLGWGAYLEGRYVEAIHQIEQLIEVETDPIEGLRSRYWRARALEHLARAGTVPDAAAGAAALREFEAIALEFPLTYYGWRARLRLPEGEDPTRAVPHTRLAAGRRRITSTDLERIRILVEAGLEDRALDELSRVAGRVGGLEDRLELAQLFSTAGYFPGAQRMVLDPYKVALARGPSATLEELWWHAWPAAYLDLVEEATRVPGSVDAALVLSIMREESGFRPQVVSPVGARGLLQIMEPTGERLAQAVGHAGFDADDLFDPRINIRLGAHYLKELSERFDGRLSAAIASYNAGPEAVSEWLEERGGLDDDEWVESIPFEQTRSYVKRVLRSLQAYRLLY